jgi:uncharacterized protein YegL
MPVRAAVDTAWATDGGVMTDGYKGARTERLRAAQADATAWPFYIVCDVSQSMWDEAFYPKQDYTPWHVMRDGMIDLLYEIDLEPRACAWCHLSVIAFSDEVQVVLPLTAMTTPNVHLGDLPKGGWTDYAAVFKFLSDRVAQDFAMLDNPGTHIKRPTVYFITDGEPQTHGKAQPDADWLPHLRALHNHKSEPIVVALGLGIVKESTLLQIRAAPGPACVAMPGVSPGDLLSAIVGDIIQSVLNSTSRGEFSFEVPAGMRRLS